MYTFISLRSDMGIDVALAGKADPTYVITELVHSSRYETIHLPSQPVAPEIFFGREQTVEKILRFLDLDQPVASN